MSSFKRAWIAAAAIGGLVLLGTAPAFADDGAGAAASIDSGSSPRDVGAKVESGGSPISGAAKIDSGSGPRAVGDTISTGSGPRKTVKK
ncbi:hypothetical protein GCM10027289_02190 [Tsukamurella serpentis]